VRETQRKGDIAKTKAICSFTNYGFDVAILITESAAYDLIVDIQKKLYRVQCKYSKNKDVDLRRIHSNSNGYVIKLYQENDYDLLYVLHADKEYLIENTVNLKKHITMNDKYLLNIG
jgi:hypothetical protein